MILSKQYLNESVQKRVLKENFYQGSYFGVKRPDRDQYDIFISYEMYFLLYHLIVCVISPHIFLMLPLNSA